MRAVVADVALAGCGRHFPTRGRLLSAALGLGLLGLGHPGFQRGVVGIVREREFPVRDHVVVAAVDARIVRQCREPRQGVPHLSVGRFHHPPAAEREDGVAGK